MKYTFRNICLVTAVAVYVGFPVTALHAQQAGHEHGAVNINFALDGVQFLLEIRSPAINFFGFEHAPSSDEDKKVVDNALDILESPVSLFVINEETGCEIRSAAANHLIDGEHEEHDEHEEHEEGAVHSEIHVDYLYKCSTPAALASLTVSLYEQFPGIDRIDYQGALPGGQVSGTLSQETATIKLK